MAKRTWKESMTNKPFDWNKFTSNAAKVLNDEAGFRDPASAAKKKQPYWAHRNGELIDLNDDNAFKKEFSDAAIEQNVRAKVNQNKKKYPKHPYKGLSTSDIVVAEAAEDKAKKKLQTLKTKLNYSPLYLDSSIDFYGLDLPDSSETEKELMLKRQKINSTLDDRDSELGLGSLLGFRKGDI